VRPYGEDAEGPFYKPGALERLSTGSGLAISGEVHSYPGCRPIPERAWSGGTRIGPGGTSIPPGDAEDRGDGRYAFTTSPPASTRAARPTSLQGLRAGAQAAHDPDLPAWWEKSVRFDLVIESVKGNR